jgi:hypothetical protein
MMQKDNPDRTSRAASSCDSQDSKMEDAVLREQEAYEEVCACESRELCL